MATTVLRGAIDALTTLDESFALFSPSLVTFHTD